MNCYVVSFTAEPYPDLQHFITFADNDRTAKIVARQYFYTYFKITITPKRAYPYPDQTPHRLVTKRRVRERREAR